MSYSYCACGRRTNQPVCGECEPLQRRVHRTQRQFYRRIEGVELVPGDIPPAQIDAIIASHTAWQKYRRNVQTNERPTA